MKDDGFLPNIFPDVTIMTYNHNADFLYQAAPTTAQRSGEQLLEKIARWRAKSVSSTSRPSDIHILNIRRATLPLSF